MIFGLQFALIFAGYGAVSNLSGQYIKHYTNANHFEIGLYFMIPPLMVFARPIICAQADRYQSHQRIYTWCLFGTGISYLPYVVIPFLIQYEGFEEILTEQVRFWIFTFFHLIGSCYFDGVRGLADAVAMNYSKRVDIEYVSLRKWAPVGFGVFGFLFGHINKDWFLPDFVPSMVLFCCCMFTLGSLVHLWPEEHFKIVTEKTRNTIGELPTGRETFNYIRSRVCRELTCSSAKETELEAYYSRTGPRQEPKQLDYLSVSQQLSIFKLIIKRDFRIPLTLFLLLVGGWICRSAQNFVFIYMEKTCKEKHTCNGSSLAGAMIGGFSILEFLTYVIMNFFSGRRLNVILLIETAILGIAAHYYFYAFIIDRTSPYYFLVESLHGFEFALFISTCLNWGFMFANQVEYLIPELLRNGVINGKENNLELVKVSLIATMMSCMTLFYDGIGSTIGAVLYGWIIEHYSFKMAWILNGSLASLAFLTVLISILLGRCLHLRPTILKLRDQTLKAEC